MWEVNLFQCRFLSCFFGLVRGFRKIHGDPVPSRKGQGNQRRQLQHSCVLHGTGEKHSFYANKIRVVVKIMVPFWVP